MSEESLEAELMALDADMQSKDELDIVELDEESWAKPGTTAVERLPAISNAATTRSSFFISTSAECGFAR